MEEKCKNKKQKFALIVRPVCGLLFKPAFQRLAVILLTPLGKLSIGDGWKGGCLYTADCKGTCLLYYL